MNKYQEALEFLVKGSNCNCEECEECSINKFCHKYEAIQTLQELVDKAMSKKPSDIDNSAGYCSNCKAVVLKIENYCSKCGQKIDWSK